LTRSALPLPPLIAQSIADHYSSIEIEADGALGFSHSWEMYRNARCDAPNADQLIKKALTEFPKLKAIVFFITYEYETNLPFAFRLRGAECETKYETYKRCISPEDGGQTCFLKYGGCLE